MCGTSIGHRGRGTSHRLGHPRPGHSGPWAARWGGLAAPSLCVLFSLRQMLLDTQASLWGGAAAPRAPWAGVWMEMGQEAVSAATASAQGPAGGLGSGPACWNERPAGALGSDTASGWTGPGDLAGSITSSEPGAVRSGQYPCPSPLPWPGLGGAAWTQVLGQGWWQGVHRPCK